MKGCDSVNGYKALIASSSEDFRNNISLMLGEAGITDVSVTDGSNIRELFASREYDLLITILPVESRSALEDISFISHSYMTGQIVFSPARIYDEISSRLAGTNTVILPRSAPKSMILSAIQCTAAYKAKLDMLKNENASLRNTVNEMKLVNRAKCVLMEYLRISEKDAHRQIQKRAMDNRTTLTEIAADIIKTYEYR